MAGYRVISERAGQRVYDQIDLSELLLDFPCHCFFGLIAEGIAKNRKSFQALALGQVFEGHGIVPAGGGGLILTRLAFKAHIDGITIVSECGNDA
ncbi:hypothetical protein SDC9_206450 [bioreactor metagenome]|uniref:Uncharacterized protein n=1 Tax=bioreactor metagenome TaxID=1076179 RepID=A0A645J5S2_9ZZZZ